MKRIKKNLIPAFLIFSILIFLISFLSNFILGRALKEEPESTEISAPPQKTKDQKAIAVKALPPELPQDSPKHVLVPEDPAKYGMIVTEPIDRPRNQDEWDIFMTRIIIDKKLLDQPQIKKAIKASQGTQEEQQKRREKLDELIQLLEKQKFDNPGDEQVDIQLQNLYRIKSLAKAMEPVISSNE